MILLGPLYLCVTPFPGNVGRTCSQPIDVSGDGMCHFFDYVTLHKSPSCYHNSPCCFEESICAEKGLIIYLTLL